MVGCPARSARDSLLREGRRSHDRSQSRTDKACQRDREKRDDYDDDNNSAITLVIWKITPAGPPAGVFFFWRANTPVLKPAHLLHAELSTFVTARKFLVPLPRALDNGIESLELWAPPKFAFDFFRRGDQTRRVAGTARLFRNGNRTASN